MKIIKSSIYLLICVLCFIKLSGQPIDTVNKYYLNTYSNLNPPTNILLNRGIVFPNKIQEIVDVATGVALLTNSCLWIEAYRGIKNSFIKQENNKFGFDETTLTDNDVYNNVVPIGIILIQANYIKNEHLNENTFNATNNTFDNKQIKFDSVLVFNVANLKPLIVSEKVRFTLKDEYIYSNLKTPIDSIWIDFDNNYKKKTDLNEVVEINYNTSGKKTIEFILYTDGRMFSAKSTIEIIKINTEKPIFGDLNVNLNGIETGAFYEIYLGEDQRLDKPVIIIEGFDPSKKRNQIATFLKYYRAGIWDEISKNKYDLISVRFKNNNDALERNTILVQNIIKRINELKKNNEEGIVIGESMGGIIARMALVNLEKEKYDHQIGLYISFDSPHAGANVPLSIQEFGHDLQHLDFHFVPDIIRELIPGITFGVSLGGFTDAILDLASCYFESAETTINKLNSNNTIAARQMLIRHRDYPHEINKNFLELKEKLNQIGYPETTRNISLINGNNLAKERNFNINTSTYLNLDFDILIIRLVAKALVSPINEKKTVSRIELCFGWGWFSWCLVDEPGEFTFFEHALDNSPGSNISTISEFDNNIFTFVPVSSSIDINDKYLIENSYLYKYDQSNNRKNSFDKGKLVETKATPFNDIYANSINSKHTEFNELNEQINKINIYEFMPEYKFIQNKVLKEGWKRDYFNSKIITLGRNVNIWEDKLVEKKEVIFEKNTMVEFIPSEEINFKPGVHIMKGASVTATIAKDNMQNNNHYRTANRNKREDNKIDVNRIIPYPEIKIRSIEENLIDLYIDNIYVNASNEEYLWKIIDENNDVINAKGKEIKFKVNKNGIYKINCRYLNSDKDDTEMISINFEDKVLNTVNSEKKNIKLINDVNIYPNPNTGSFTLKFGDITEILKINIIDVFGRAVGYTINYNNTEAIISTNHRKSGIYFVNILFKGGQITKKIILD